MQRRRFLASLLAAGTAGCLELESGDPTASTMAATRTTAATATEHPTTTRSATTTDAATEEPTEEETTTEPRKYAQPLWAFEPDAQLERPPAVVDDTVITATRDDSAYALATASGDQHWSENEPTVNNRTRPQTVDGSVLFWNSSGLSAHRVADGRARWRVDARIESQPAYDGDLLYVFGVDYGQALAAIDPGTGTRQWSMEPEEPLGGARSTVVVDGVVVDAHYEGTVYAFDAATGDPLWSYPKPKAETKVVDLATDGSRVFAVYRNSTRGGAGPLVALDPTDGSQRWSQYEGGETLSNGGSAAPKLLVHDGTLYVSHTGLHAVNPENGFTKWFNTDISPSLVTPANDTLYAGARVHDGVALLAIDPMSGRVRRRVNAAYGDAWGRRPAISSDTAYVVESTADGARLAAYDLTT